MDFPLHFIFCSIHYAFYFLKKDSKRGGLCRMRLVVVMWVVASSVWKKGRERESDREWKKRKEKVRCGMQPFRSRHPQRFTSNVEWRAIWMEEPRQIKTKKISEKGNQPKRKVEKNAKKTLLQSDGRNRRRTGKRNPFHVYSSILFHAPYSIASKVTDK